MIIDETIEQSRKATISTSNSNSVGTFRIKESAKAFSILSSSLYQNPIRSIIRELGCNARDAHVAAKNPEPWVLSLPSSLSPEFAVKDNGTGLSHEEVMQIYTTYFESTKTNSNDFVGALGLGSKSPFSYTDNFTVTSVKDGIKNIYSTFLTEEQIPSIVLLDSSKTNEPNGVEVRFSVKSPDFNKFHAEAIEALKFFDQMPKGYPTGYPHQIEKINGIEHVALKNYSYNSSASPLVIMGGVQYTFDTKNPEFEKYKSVLNTSRHQMLIRANIGEVDIQPSRESLTMTKKTIEFISKKFEEALSKINADIDAQINNSKKIEWDRIILRESLKHSGTEYEQRFVKSLGDTTFSIPAKYSGRCYVSYTHRKTTGISETFVGLDNQKISDSIVFVINDNKQTMRDIHDCVREHNKSRSYSTIIEFEPIPGISSEDLQKEITKYTKGYVPELTSNLCASVNSKKKIIGIVYSIGQVKSSKHGGLGFRRSSQEHFADGSYFVELDRENNVVDANGKIVANFWKKFSLYRDLGHSKDVFAIKHNSKFDRNLYKRFLDVLDSENLAKIKSLPSDQFFAPNSVSYEVRSALGSPVVKRFVSSLKDPLASVMKKLNIHAKPIFILDQYETYYPGSTKDIIAEINKFRDDFDKFHRRYETLYVLVYRDHRLLDDLLEFANWRYETKFAK